MPPRSMRCKQPAADKGVVRLLPRLLPKAMTSLPPVPPLQVARHLLPVRLIQELHSLRTPLRLQTHPEVLPRLPPAESFLWAEDDDIGDAGEVDSTSSSRLNHPMAMTTENSSWEEGEDIGGAGEVDSTSSSRLNRPMAMTTENTSWEEGEDIGGAGEVDSISSSRLNHPMATTTESSSWAADEDDTVTGGEVESVINSRTRIAMVAQIAGRVADSKWNEAAHRSVANFKDQIRKGRETWRTRILAVEVKDIAPDTPRVPGAGGHGNTRDLTTTEANPRILNSSPGYSPVWCNRSGRGFRRTEGSDEPPGTPCVHSSPRVVCQ
jgi:hypothetical protein